MIIRCTGKSLFSDTKLRIDKNKLKAHPAAVRMSNHNFRTQGLLVVTPPAKRIMVQVNLGLCLGDQKLEKNYWGS